MKSADRVGRPTCTNLCTFGRHWDGRPSGSTGSESSALCLFGSTGTVDRRLQRSDFRPLAVDRGGRPWRSTGSLSGCQLSLTASFWFGLYKLQLFGILAKFFKEKNFWFLEVLKQVFKSIGALILQSLLF